MNTQTQTILLGFVVRISQKVLLKSSIVLEENGRRKPFLFVIWPTKPRFHTFETRPFRAAAIYEYGVFYADDLVLISRSASGLQEQINILQKIHRNWFLKILSCGSLENHTRFKTIMIKIYTRFRRKRRLTIPFGKAHTCRTYVGGVLAPPPPLGTRDITALSGCRVYPGEN